MSQVREKSKHFVAARIGVIKALRRFGFERLSSEEQTRYYLESEGQTVIFFSHPKNASIGAMLRYSNDVQFSMKLFLGVTFQNEVIPTIEVALNGQGQVKDLHNQLIAVTSLADKLNDASYSVYNLVSRLKELKITTDAANAVFSAVDAALNPGVTRQHSELVPVTAGNGLAQLATVYAHYTIDHLGLKANGRAWSAKRNGRYAPVTEIRAKEKLALAAVKALLAS